MRTFENLGDFLDARHQEQEAALNALQLSPPVHEAAIADLTAKRRILDLHRATLNRHTVGRTFLGQLLNPIWVCPTCSDQQGDGYDGQVQAPCPTLIALVSPYANHPDLQALAPTIWPDNQGD